MFVHKGISSAFYGVWNFALITFFKQERLISFDYTQDELFLQFYVFVVWASNFIRIATDWYRLLCKQINTESKNVRSSASHSDLLSFSFIFKEKI